MEPGKEDITIVVFANRKDFFLTKICISSIRFYYPGVEIFLVKDKINGDFNTSALRKIFNVKLLNLGKKYYGWSSAKIHFLLQKHLPKKRYLCLDSDIIFIGRVLERIEKEKGEFVLNADMIEPPFSEENLHDYFDPEKVKVLYPDYEYPGFFFNAGQTVVTPGIIDEALLEKCFDPYRYPYFTNKMIFPTVDQSVLNAVIPILMKKNNLQVGRVRFMRWSVQFFSNNENNNVDLFLDGLTPLMIHYCGDIRTQDLGKMKGDNILKFFRDYYYIKLSGRIRLLNRLQDKLLTSKRITRILYQQNLRIINFLNRIGKPEYY
ncbi:MAG: hypothetical protein ABIN67_02060 [Ferruginibacter sp.]